MFRFKTGTPARIAGNTIDYSKMEEQFGEKKEEIISGLKSCAVFLFYGSGVGTDSAEILLADLYK